MCPASKTAPHGRSFLRRVFAVNLAWGVILYLLIDENQEANFWINLGSYPTALNIDLRPWPGCDGSNALWSVGQSDPGITARVDDALI